MTKWTIVFGKLSAAALLLLTGGCASVEDFRAMTPAERADYVCDRRRDVQRLDSQISDTESAIAETSSAIAAGYRLHRSCKQVPVTRTTEERCTTEKAEKEGDADVEVCKETAKISHERVCEEIPVVIDGAFEREKLSDYRRDLRALEDEVGRVFDSCHNEVRGMSADRAFEYYESSRGGVLGGGTLF